MGDLSIIRPSSPSPPKVLLNPAGLDISELPPFLKLCPIDSQDIQVDFGTPISTFIAHVKARLQLQGQGQGSDTHSDKPTEIIILTHGYLASSQLEQIQDIKNAILTLREGPQLLILLDWGIAAGNQIISPPNSGNWAFKLNPLCYFMVVPRLKIISEWVSPFIASLKKELGNRISIYGVGHSLGSHLLGVIAKDCEKKHGVKVFDRITGLDPAGLGIVHKLWNLQEEFKVPSLCPSDAKLVDVIHTSGGLGTHKPLGHVDFYPNFARTQPGCARLSNSSHMRVLDYFAWSVTNPGCFKTNKTFNPQKLRSSGKEPKITKSSNFVEMGFHCSPNSRGVFYLETGSEAPWDFDSMVY